MSLRLELKLAKAGSGALAGYWRTVACMQKNAHQPWIELEEQIRQEPIKAVLLAFGAGFFLCLLPLGRLLGVLVRMALILLKPALLILGVVKLLEYTGASVGISRE